MDELHWNREFALDQSGNDEEMLKELLELFHSSSGSDLERIKAAVAASDPEGLMQAAHSMKGAAASLGIEGVRSLAEELEKTGRQGGIAATADVARLDALLALAVSLDLR
ncbi:MAG: Hpt domain-containing protein [Proteobacteria bacterium]|nr:Hpt domain-containing protein [Pseudomonadota bacterium]MBU1688239.1 Hpt domain-containing protein [Pseudomonadota bacterium]